MKPCLIDLNGSCDPGEATHADVAPSGIASLCNGKVGFCVFLDSPSYTEGWRAVQVTPELMALPEYEDHMNF
jgi:hypothetical protein